jgi:PAS domain S-box-containing protein
MSENWRKGIPDDFLSKWQDMADLLAKLLDVPAALIMKAEDEFMKVFISSNSGNNPYKVGDKEHRHGLYCETVIKTQKKLLVPNALHDKNWDKNPDISLGMIAYLGLPINFPDQTPFGTLCALDNKENTFRSEQEQLLKQFKDVIESDLALIQTANERKQAEAALRQSEEKFRSLADTAKVAISIVADASGAKYLYVNNEWSRIFGYNKEEAQNLKPIDVVAPEYRQLILKNAANRIAGKPPPHSYELKTITKRGEIKYIEFSSTLINFENQKVFLTSGIEITKRKQAEEALRKSEEKLRELNAQKDKFFSIIAHDLKSPFNAIMGFSELLINQINEKDYDGIERYASIILQSSQNAVELLKNLLEWALSQSDMIEFAPVQLELTHLIEQTLSELRHFADQKSIKLLNDIQGHLSVFADKNMTGTVIRNLVTNAIKFTREGGAVHISAQNTPKEIIVSVKDNGVGIDSTKIEGLFRLDANVSTPGTNKEKGTGLGLILCKEFVKKHGGRIWVESEAGKGSEFSFSLPLVAGNISG